MSAKEQAEEQKNLGNEEFQLKNFDKAIEYYSQSIELDPENHVYYSNRSAAYGAISKWELAEIDAKKCVELNPTFAKGYHRLASAQRQLGKVHDAIATLKKAETDATEADKVPGIRKLLRELTRSISKESEEDKKSVTLSTGHGQRQVPAHIAKELQELQPQFLQLSRESEQVDAKIAAYARQKKRIDLVMKEMEQLPSNVATYRSIGKMFLLTNQDENEEKMKKETTRINELMESLEARKKYLTRQKKSLEESITELLAQCNT